MADDFESLEQQMKDAELTFEQLEASLIRALGQKSQVAIKKTASELKDLVKQTIDLIKQQDKQKNGAEALLKSLQKQQRATEQGSDAWKGYDKDIERAIKKSEAVAQSQDKMAKLAMSANRAVTATGASAKRTAKQIEGLSDAFDDTSSSADRAADKIEEVGKAQGSTVIETAALVGGLELLNSKMQQGLQFMTDTVRLNEQLNRQQVQLGTAISGSTKFISEQLAGFKNLRSELLLTREDWAAMATLINQGLDLGISLEQTSQLARELTDVLGKAEGLRALAEFQQVSAGNMLLGRVAAAGGNTEAVRQTAMAGGMTQQQIQALVTISERGNLEAANGTIKMLDSIDAMKDALKEGIGDMLGPLGSFAPLLKETIGIGVGTLIQISQLYQIIGLLAAQRGGGGIPFGGRGGKGAKGAKGLGGRMGRFGGAAKGLGVGLAVGLVTTGVQMALEASASEQGRAGNFEGQVSSERTSAGVGLVGGTAAGALTGAAIGSLIPVIGTVIGAAVGGAIGALTNLEPALDAFGDTVANQAEKIRSAKIAEELTAATKGLAILLQSGAAAVQKLGLDTVELANRQIAEVALEITQGISTFEGMQGLTQEIGSLFREEIVRRRKAIDDANAVLVEENFENKSQLENNKKLTASQKKGLRNTIAANEAQIRLTNAVGKQLEAQIAAQRFALEAAPARRDIERIEAERRIREAGPLGLDVAMAEQFGAVGGGTAMGIDQAQIAKFELATKALLDVPKLLDRHQKIQSAAWQKAVREARLAGDKRFAEGGQADRILGGIGEAAPGAEKRAKIGQLEAMFPAMSRQVGQTKELLAAREAVNKEMIDAVSKAIEAANIPLPEIAQTARGRTIQVTGDALKQLEQIAALGAKGNDLAEITRKALSNELRASTMQIAMNHRTIQNAENQLVELTRVEKQIGAESGSEMAVLISNTKHFLSNQILQTKQLQKIEQGKRFLTALNTLNTAVQNISRGQVPLGQAQQQLATAQMGLAGAVGVAPEEKKAIAKRQAAAAKFTLDAFESNMEAQRGAIQKAFDAQMTAGGGDPAKQEAARVNLATKLTQLETQRVNLQTTATQLAIEASTAEIDAYKRRLTFSEDILSLESQRLQQVGAPIEEFFAVEEKRAVIAVQQLRLAQEAFNNVKKIVDASGGSAQDQENFLRRGKELAEARLHAQEAIIGPQRKFLDDFLGRMFNLRGGTKVQPLALGMRDMFGDRGARGGIVEQSVSGRLMAGGSATMTPQERSRRRVAAARTSLTDPRPPSIGPEDVARAGRGSAAGGAMTLPEVVIRPELSLKLRITAPEFLKVEVIEKAVNEVLRKRGAVVEN